MRYGLAKRIGARDAALNEERGAHKKRIERAPSTPDALWGRRSDSMSKDLTQHRTSDSTADSTPFSYVTTSDIEGAAGVIVTGPDAEDVHVIGGDRDE